MSEINPITENTSREDEGLSLSELFSLSIAHWRWFVLSVLLCGLVALFYVLRTPATYQRSASVLIKEDSKSSSINGALSDFSDMGLFQSTNNIYNELAIFQSPSLMLETIRRMNLDISYLEDGTFHKNVCYGQNLPVIVSLPDLGDSESASFTLEVKEDGSFKAYDFKKGDESFRSSVSGAIGTGAVSPLGEILVEKANNFKAKKLYVTRTNLYSVVTGYSNRFTAALSNKQSTVIDLTFKDTSVQRAEDVLNTLIVVYNENWVKDKNQVAVSTSMFIGDRLDAIEKELGGVDEDISTFKSDNQLAANLDATSQIFMERAEKTTSELQALNNQLSMSRYVRSFMLSESGQKSVLPSNAGIESASIESAIKEYNTKFLERSSLVANSSEQNPLVQDLDEALASMRGAIVTSIDNHILNLETQIKAFRQTNALTQKQISDSPDKEKYLLSVERQQKVKESLYLFLLQKREENELTQAFSAYNTRVITPPSGSMNPIAPRRMIILLVGLMIGFCIPLAWIYIKEMLNTTLRGKQDLKSVTVPFIGEIPFVEDDGVKPLARMLHSIVPSRFRKVEDKRKVVVKEGNRDVMNEAFRVLRTNLEFMNKDGKEKVLLVTSFNPGSGKSFISMNTAISFAIKGKKVLLIDGDLRHASISSYIGSPKIGSSAYLSGQKEDLESMIVPAKDFHKNLYVLPVGMIPPNPTELLETERFKMLVENVREAYDLVMIDCPPIEIVADTKIIEQMADRCVFLVRAGLFERSMLPELEGRYKKKEYKNMALILNGTKAYGGHYGYRYGYRYGYHSKRGSYYYHSATDGKA